MGLVASPRACAGSAASWTAAPSSQSYSAPLLQLWLCKRGDATLSALGWRPVTAFSRVRETVALPDAPLICLICPAGAGEFVQGRQDEPWCLMQEHNYIF